MIAAVDGCKGGWLVAMSDQWPPQTIITATVCPDFEEVLKIVFDCSTVVVDMPIGLPESGIRKCDAEARGVLGKTGTSTVFNTPPRASLAAQDKYEFQEIVKKINGVGAGYPVWGIVPKLKDLDSQMTVQIEQTVKEYHPELAWKHCAQAALLSKHSAAGLLQRLELISAVVPDFLSVGKTIVNPKVQLDDVLDAFIGLSVAYRISNGIAHKIPAGAEQRDEKGLSMEIWY